MAFSRAVLLAQIGQHLHNTGLATYSATGIYPANPPKPAVFYGMLPDTPTPAVAVNIYGVDPDPHTVQHNPRIFVQFRWRATDYLVAHQLADDAFERLHNLAPADWAGLSVEWATRNITAPPDQDSNGRWSRADSYEIRCNP